MCVKMNDMMWMIHINLREQQASCSFKKKREKPLWNTPNFKELHLHSISKWAAHGGGKMNCCACVCDTYIHTHTHMHSIHAGSLCLRQSELLPSINLTKTGSFTHTSNDDKRCVCACACVCMHDTWQGTGLNTWKSCLLKCNRQLLRYFWCDLKQMSASAAQVTVMRQQYRSKMLNHTKIMCSH